ncbi:MAG: ribonuclease P protein component [Anaerolineae bacterium]
MERRYRLRRNADFQRVRREGKAWSHRLIVLVSLPNHLANNRYGFVVSKRLGKAVRRNLIKRRMREVVRLHQEEISQGWDLVFIARQPTSISSFREIEQAIENLLRRSGLLEVSVKQR